MSSSQSRNRNMKLKRITDEILVRSDFVEAAEALRGKPDLIIWTSLAPRFKLPSESYSYVMNHLRGDAPNENDFSAPVSLVSEVDETLTPAYDPKLAFKMHQVANQKWPSGRRLYIEVSPGITRTHIINFLETNGPLVDEKLELLNSGKKPEPPHPTSYQARDDGIYNARTRDKRRYKDIGEEFNVSPEYASKIVAKEKKKRELSSRAPLSSTPDSD